jgi:hypothetical protein
VQSPGARSGTAKRAALASWEVAHLQHHQTSIRAWSVLNWVAWPQKGRCSLRYGTASLTLTACGIERNADFDRLGRMVRTSIGCG